MYISYSNNVIDNWPGRLQDYTSANKITAQLTAGSLKKSLVLFPRETNLVKLNDGGAGQAPTATLVTLQHSGLPGDLITTGYVLNLKDGYSSAFTMSDPGNLRSNRLAGAHFRAGQPDPAEGFPEGTRFHSPLLLANISAQPVMAHVSVDYTLKDVQDSQGNGNDAQKNSAATAKGMVAKVKDLTIAPGDVQSVELSDSLGGVGTIAEAGVDIAYDGAPGSLIGQLTSVDQSGDYSFEVPIKDPAAMSEMLESDYPWTLEDGMRTVFHLKNTTDKSVDALGEFNFTGGIYNLGQIELQPYQTIAIDIQKLKDSKKLDNSGRTFPVGATNGQFAWFEETPHTMIGRAEQENPKSGIAKSFSCEVQCCGYIWNDRVYPSSLAVPVGYSGYPLEGEYQLSDCDGNFGADWYPIDVQTNSWSSDATNVAEIIDQNVYTPGVSAVGGGVANIQGIFNEHNWALNDHDDCIRVEDSNDPQSSQVTVLVPTSLAIVSGTDSTTSEASCSIPGGTGCGVARSFTFQVKDQNNNPLQVGGYDVWDAFGMPSPNGLNLSSNFTTTCSPGNPNGGPCGPQTDGSGQFNELSLSVCSGVCRPSSACTTGGGAYSQVTQTWHVGPSSINQTIRYYCDHVTVNGQ